MEKNRQENTEDEKTEKFSGNVSEESDSDSSQNEEQQSSKKGKLCKNEIRSVLLGNFALNEEGKTVAGRNSLITSNGIEDGAAQVLFWGITKLSFSYRSKLRNFQQVRFKVLKTMADIGRVFYMESAPEAAACCVKGLVFRPVVLVFEEKADTGKYSSSLRLTAYCGRSPLAFIPILRAVSRFDKHLPREVFRRSEKNDKKKKTDDNN